MISYSNNFKIRQNSCPSRETSLALNSNHSCFWYPVFNFILQKYYVDLITNKTMYKLIRKVMYKQNVKL